MNNQTIDSSLNPDHFYNEIAENESKNKHRNRERERTERSSRCVETRVTEAKKVSKTLTDEQQKSKPSNQDLLVLQQIAEFSENPSLNDSQSNLIFKKNIASIAKLKSPERKILYKEWFSIIKRMEKDPKFDLETLVRTRGRFTDHENISYRDKLIMNGKQDKLRCARSEPNFGAFMYQNNNNMSRTRGGINTVPATTKGGRSDVEANQRLRRNFSENTGNKVNPVKSEGFLENNSSSKKENPVLASAVKLTLEKSDINKIKEILKKDKSLISELKSKTKSPAISKANQPRTLLKDSVLSNYKFK